MAQRRLVARLGMRGGVWQNKSELRMPIPHILEVKAIFGSKDLFFFGLPHVPNLTAVKSCSVKVPLVFLEVTI